MKTAWTVLIISAFTDFIITAGTALMTAMVSMGTTEMPSSPVILITVVGGVVQAARTIQQALKSTPETSAALKGSPSTVSTTTFEKTP